MVSVCIPTYNNPTSLRRLLDSIAIQTYRDYEIIITDDSPNDSICDEVLGFQSRYSEIRLKYYKNETGLGPTKNTNRAISYAKGNLLKIMHHDDYFSDEKSLEKLVGIIEREQVDFAFCGSKEIVFCENGLIDTERSYERSISEIEEYQLKETINNLFLVNMIGAPSATIIKRDLLEKKKITLDDNLKWLVDIDYYLRILEKSKYAYTKEPLVSIVSSDTQVTRECIDDNHIIFDETLYVFKKYNFDYDKRYRKYLIRLGLRYKEKYSKFKTAKITRWEYFKNKYICLVKKIIKK